MAVVCARECQAQQPNQAEQNEEKPKRHHIADGIESSTVDYKADGQRKQHHCQIDGDQAGDEGETPPGSRFSLAAPMSFLFRRKRGIGKSHRLELLLQTLILHGRVCLSMRIGRDDMNLLSPHTLLAVWCAGFTGIHALHVSLSSSADIQQTIYHSPPQKLRGELGNIVTMSKSNFGIAHFVYK